MEGFDEKTKDELIVKSYLSPKKRAVKALHPPEYIGKRVLAVCMQPESYVKPHLHSSDISETMTYLQGDFLLVFFNNQGRVDKFFRLNASGNKTVEIPSRTYHTLISLEKDSILFETSQGPYNPENYSSYSSWGPTEEDSASVKEYLNHLKCLIDCIFCRRADIKEDILFESKNFFVKVGFGINCPGHVLLITKDHYDCFADIPEELTKESEELIEKINTINKDNFGESYIFEAGAIGQSVFHAHLHIIPKKREETNLYKSFNFNGVVEDILIPLKIKFKEVSPNDLKTIRKEVGGYTSLIDKDRTYVIGDASDSVSQIINIRDLLNRHFGFKDMPSSWLNLSKEMKEIDEYKRNKTKEIWKKSI